VRLPAIQPFLDVLPQLAADGIPLFLAGDFNSPSHQDWEPPTIDRWRFRRYSVGWPVAQAIRAAGFRDSYRRKHPDVLAYPGFTWWAGRPEIPGYNPGPPDSWPSRIDFIWYAGPSGVTQSTLVGEDGTAGVTIAVTPWPSDHRAVLSDFATEPAPMPLLVAASRRVYRSGDQISIVYSNRTPAGALLIAPVSDGERGEPWRRIEAIALRNTLQVDGLPPATGQYVVVLDDSEGKTVSQNDLWVLPAGARPMIETRSESYAQDEPLSLKWRNAPGNRYDWVVIYPEGADHRDSYVAWAHVQARIEGEMTLDAGHAVAGWPLPPGRYVAALMEDDGFELLAESAPFEMRVREQAPQSRKSSP
jgi:hypothetical protein